MSRREATGLAFMVTIYVYVFPRCPFIVSMREHCCIASVIHAPFEKRDLYGTSRVHSRVLRRYSSFRWLRFRERSPQTRKHAWQMRLLQNICDIIISSSEPTICSSFTRSSADIWIDANNRCGFSLKGNWRQFVRYWDKKTNVLHLRVIFHFFRFKLCHVDCLRNLTPIDKQ